MMLRVAWLLVVVAAAGCGAESQRVLSHDLLIAGRGLDPPVPLTEFAPVGTPVPASNDFRGRLVLETGEPVEHFLLLVDEFGLVTPERPGIDTLPAFDFEFVSDGDYLVAKETGPVINEHGWWEFVFTTGRAWDEPLDKGWSRASIPFALKERAEDCIHNGLLTFLFRESGEVSQVAFQVVNQTCRYLQFEMAGLVDARYVPAVVADADELVATAASLRQGRMPTRPIADLEAGFPGADAANFGSEKEIARFDMTAYGFVVDDTHYVGGCETPYGTYPWCDDLALPSYSTAKSIVGGFGLMRLEALHPGARNETIADLVPECGDSFSDVTVEHALDMTTGHFGSPDLHGDEDAALNSRFFAGDHAVKIDVACNGFPRKADPGTHLSYHTWDTYLAGTAMNAVLRRERGPDADYFDDLLVADIWRPLGLSRIAAATRRTYDEVQQPYTGFGLTLLRNDVARLAQFIGRDDGRLGDVELLDRALFDAIKRRVPGDPGLVAELETIRYNNGFRSFDVSTYIGCGDPVWVVVLSGFGGIIVAIMPNDTAYYYFSDGNVHRYLSAVRESHRIRPMCADAEQPGAAS